MGLTVVGSPVLAQPTILQAPEGLAEGALLYSLEEAAIGGRHAGVVTQVYRVSPTGARLVLRVDEALSLIGAVQVAASGDRLTRVDAGVRETRAGWVTVQIGEVYSLAIDGVEIGLGSARLRLSPGTYTLTLGGGTNEVQEHNVLVQARREIRIDGPMLGGDAPRASSDTASAPENLAGHPLSSEAGLPQRLFTISVYAEGGEQVFAPPASGWRMTVTLRPDSGPAEMTLDEPLQRRNGPLSRSSPSATIQNCPASSPLELVRTANELVLDAQYAAARACLVRHIALEPADRDAIKLSAALERLVIVEIALSDEQRASVSGFRERARAGRQSGDRDVMIRASERLLALLPGDVATIQLFRAVLDTTIAPNGGPSLSLIFVPGQNARPPDDPSRLAEGGAPPEEYLLSKHEITNAQFAYFLNTTTRRSEEPYLVPRPSHVEMTRSSGWQVAEGDENLPVVDATWFGAAAYAEWAGGRLPTQVEWRWAYQLGEDRDVRANLGDVSRGTWDVTESEPDAFGLHDMLGNVWEWLAAANDRPSRAAIGGSFSTSPTTLYSQLSRQANALHPSGHIGFRVLFPLIDSSP